MSIPSDRRRRTTIPAVPASGSAVAEGWISLVGQGPGFHDCPLCRELASHSQADAASGAVGASAAIDTIVGINPESLPELMRSGWLDDLIALVGPNAKVQLMGRDLVAEPVEELSMEAFLARLGYE